MGWNTIGSNGMADKEMTDGQRRAIRSLRAQLDGRHIDDYEQFDIPEMSRLQASQHISELKNKLDRRRKS